MKQLTSNLQKLIKTNIDAYRLSEYLLNEEYMDEDRNPIKCQYCNSENLIKHHKVEFEKIEDKYKEQIKDIYPEIENNIITFWVCNDCDSVVAIKLYSHKSHNEKKIYYSKFDSFNEIINDLQKNGYLDWQTKEPCQCWYCQSDKIKIVKEENCEKAICENCNKILGYNYNNIWNLKVELEE